MRHIMRYALALLLTALHLGACNENTAASTAPNQQPTADTTRQRAAQPAAPTAPSAEVPNVRPPSSGRDEVADDSKRRTRVVFLGDSISAGLHLPQDAAFPALLSRQLAAAGLPFELINAGVSGDTSSGGLRRVDWVLKQQPQVVVIELGGNDGLRGVPLDHIENNLRAIIDKVRKANATPLLLGMRLPTSYGQLYVQGFDALFPRIATELDVPFVPFFMAGVAGEAEMNLEDGLHPTERGHERLAENIYPTLSQLLRATATGSP